MELKTLFEVFTTTITMIATIAIPIVLAKGQKRAEAIKAVASIDQEWNSFNSLVLSNPEHLKVVSKIPGLGFNHFFSIKPNDRNFEEEEVCSEQTILIQGYLICNALNIFNTTYLYFKSGLISKEHIGSQFFDILYPMVNQSEFAFYLSQNGGFVKEFADLCKNMRNSKELKTSLIFSEHQLSEIEKLSKIEEKKQLEESQNQPKLCDEDEQ
jgi:hypothetical protein